MKIWPLIFCLSGCIVTEPELIVRFRPTPPSVKVTNEPTPLVSSPTPTPIVPPQQPPVTTVTDTTVAVRTRTAEDEFQPLVRFTPKPTPTPTSTPAPTAPPAVSALRVIITPGFSPDLKQGQYQQVLAQVHYSDGSILQQAEWSSSDAQIASVTAEGWVTAHLPGTVTLTAQAPHDERIQRTLELTITPSSQPLGGRIVYVANQDLYLMDGQTSPVRRLTQNGATQAKLLPRLSWDGNQVTYSTPTRAVFVMSTLVENGTPTNAGVPPGSTLEPLPYFYNAGELVFQTGKLPSANSPPTMWVKLPNGTLAPVNNTLGGIQALAGLDVHGLTLYEQNGRIRRAFYTDIATMRDLGPGTQPRTATSFEPNQVVFIHEREVWRMDYDGQRVQLTHHTPPDVFHRYPSISPDQTQVVFVSERHGQSDLYIMNAWDGSGLYNLTRTPDINEDMPDWGS